MRLRAPVERGLRNRWLGPALVLLLAVLLALLVLHSAIDETLALGLVACVASALLLGAMAFAPPLGTGREARSLSPRAPPVLLAYRGVSAGARYSSPPLRL
jgi:hypothetical protein